jgi:hypothetical protein
MCLSLGQLPRTWWGMRRDFYNVDSAQWLFEGVKSSRELAVLVANEPRRKSERHSLSYCGPLVAVMQDKDLTFKRGSSNNEASPTNWPR